MVLHFSQRLAAADGTPVCGHDSEGETKEEVTMGASRSIKGGGWWFVRSNVNKPQILNADVSHTAKVPT